MSNRPSYREEVESMRDGFSGGRLNSDWPKENDQAAWRVLGIFVAIIAIVVMALCFVGKACSAQFISESTCKVCEFERADGSTTAYGSGVLVAKADGAGYVLTARHVIEGQDGASYVAIFPRSRGFAYTARSIVTAPDPDVDMAMIVIPAPADISPRPIRWIPVADGERVWQSGFGSERTGGPRESWSFSLPLRRLTSHGGEVRYAGPSIMLLTKPARQGDSGGPVIDARGRVVGIMAATDSTTGYHVTLADQEWLKAALPENSILVQP